MSGFEYGNTRIRARRTRLFDGSDYSEMLNVSDLERLTGILASGPYQADVEAMMPRHSGLRRIDGAIASRLAREFRQIAGFYPEPHRSRLSLVLGRWDVRNVLTLVRALTRRGGGSALAVELLPAGRISPAVLEELATQGEVRAMLDLLVTWRLPSPEMARCIRRSLPELERTGDPLPIEAAVHRGFALEVAEAVAEDPDDALSRQLRAEADKVDLSTAVRLRAARRHGEPLPDLDQVWLGSGTVRPTGLVGLVIDDEPEAAIAELGTLPSGFREALGAWAGQGDAVRLADDLDRALLRLARSGLAADPLGMGVPVGYIWELESEARNLRMIARAIAGGLDPVELEDRLVLS